MPFQLSPGVAVVEKDFSSIVPAVSTSAGAYAGVFSWGPVLDPVTVTSENVLVQRFGKPTDAKAHFQSFFTAANFLAYTNNLLLVRADTGGNLNAVATQSGSVTGYTALVGGDTYASPPAVTISAPDITGGIQAEAHSVLSGGIVTSIVIDEPGSGYTSVPTMTIAVGPGVDATVTAVVTVGGVKINNTDAYTTSYINGGGAYGGWAAKYPGALGNSIKISICDSASWNPTHTGGGFVIGTTYTILTLGSTDFTDIGAMEGIVGETFVATGVGTGTGTASTVWDYKAQFDFAPNTSTTAAKTANGADDEVHVIVIDSLGLWTGTAGTVLEKYTGLSKANDNRKSDGSNNYYRDVLNAQSKYVWWMDHPTDGANWGSETNTEFDTLVVAETSSLSGGMDDLVATDGDLMTAFSIFANDMLYDISLVPAGPASSVVANHIINNVTAARKDCVAFVSPQNISSGEVIIGAGSDAVDAVVAYRNLLPASTEEGSYGVLDSGYKYQYDRYNDKYRWIPLNGDIAGLCARTDHTDDPWYSPGGYNRGQIKNIVKLAVNPGQTERDTLYKSGVNPVVNFPGQGTVLFGDKTLQAKPSAFDRINVRRLFIVLEKAIATAAKYQLFEFNDSFTRAQFKNLVEPFLRDVQGRRGVTDFRVKCDEVNNTGEVIDSNQFVADIYIKPNRSINFITLSFVAARSAVSFEEIGA